MLKVLSPPLWRQIQRENFTNLGELATFLELSEENKEKLHFSPRFILNVPRRLAEKMEKNSLMDPLFRQFVPLKEELIEDPNFSEDPVKDCFFQKAPKLLQKYHGRALLVTTSACAMHCRYCFRQNYPYESTNLQFTKELEFIQKEKSLEEIILSGGDPLSLNNEKLGSLLKPLNEIPHIQRIRFHSRFIVGIPERVDEGLLELFKESKKQIYFVFHINHSREIDEEVALVATRLRETGAILLNQSVLLKGVNDEEKSLEELSRALLKAGILPYYLHMLDPVTGTSHFAVLEKRAKELISYMQSRLSGFGVPRLVREEVGKKNKTTLSL